MSLDISLMAESGEVRTHSGIFIREGGQTKEISEEEWKKRYPRRSPVRMKQVQPGVVSEVYSVNITHNLGTMADKAGIYTALWRPEEEGWKVAKDIVPALESGLIQLVDRPDEFKKYNPENGWGSYDLLVDVVKSYLEACRKYPDAKIEVSR